MPSAPQPRTQPSPYLKFTRPEWAALRANTPSPMSDADLDALRGLNSSVSLADVAEVYLPLSRLLNLHVAAARSLGTAVESTFLGRPSVSTPYVIAVAGSVAVGKSTFARVLQATLSHWEDRPKVDLVTIGRWYRNRFFLLQKTAFQRPASYFHRFHDLSEEEAEKVAGNIWREINLPNLMTSILPTRERARLVIRMDSTHSVGEVWLRRA